MSEKPKALRAEGAKPRTRIIAWPKEVVVADVPGGFGAYADVVEVIELEPVLDLLERWYECAWGNVWQTVEARTHALLREHGREPKKKP